MFQNLDNTQVQVSSEEDLLAAAGLEKKEDKTKTKDKTDKNKPDEKPDAKTDKVKKGKPGSEKTVTELSKKTLEEAMGDDEPEEEEIEEEKEDDNKDDDNQEGEVTDDEDDNKDDDNQEGEVTDDDAEPDEEQDEAAEVSNFLKVRAQFLIKKGEWKDFQGSDEVEWDEDTFAEIELTQRQWQKEDQREEILNSFGPYGRDIAEYSSQGGDPEDLIEIFREKQEIEGLSLDTEDAQRNVMLKYATEYLSMKPDKAKNYVNSLIADKTLEEDAKEAKEKMETGVKAEEKALKEQQAQIAKNAKLAVKQNQAQFSKSVTENINSRADIPIEEKRELIKVLTKFDKVLNNGTEVNDFYFRFAEFRKDIPNYIELVRLVLDPKKYVKTVKNEGASAASEKDFRLIRTSNKSKKMKSSPTGGRSDSGSKKSSGFKLLY